MSSRLVLFLTVLAGMAGGFWLGRPTPPPSVRSMFRAVTTQSPKAPEAETTTTVGQGQARAKPATPTSANPRSKPTTRVSGPENARVSTEPAAGLAPASALEIRWLDIDVAGSSAPPASEPVVAAIAAATASDVAPAVRAEPVPSTSLPAAKSRDVVPVPRVYTIADLDVTPPEAIEGNKKLGGIVGAIESKATVTIEFVVNELGLVESAKGKTSPRTIGESLLIATGLQVIKSWRFQPAHKNGQAVSYRKSISFGAY